MAATAKQKLQMCVEPKQPAHCGSALPLVIVVLVVNSIQSPRTRYHAVHKYVALFSPDPESARCLEKLLDTLVILRCRRWVHSSSFADVNPASITVGDESCTKKPSSKKTPSSWAEPFLNLYRYLAVQETPIHHPSP